MSFYDILLAEKLSGGTVPTGKIQITQNANDIDIAQYATADVNVSTDPAKGLVFDEWDNDGIPTRLRFFGITTIPENYMRFWDYAILPGNIETIEFPNTLTSIGARAFIGFSKVKKLDIPASCTSFGVLAFYQSKACEEIIIRGDVSSLSQVLGGMTALKRCIFLGNLGFIAWANPFNFDNNQIELYDFSGCNQVIRLTNLQQLPHADGCVIKVKQSLLAEWQAAIVWKDFPTDSAEPGYVVWQGV